MIQLHGNTYLDASESRKVLMTWIAEDARDLKNELGEIKKKHAIEYV